jgi:hypothetical protein
LLADKTIMNLLQSFIAAAQRLEPPASASPYMRDVIAALNGSTRRTAYNERDALKLVEEPWIRIKAAPPEDRLSFVFEALAYDDPKTLALTLALKAMAAGLLRGKLPLNTLEAVRLIEMVSKPRHSFPYKAILSALDELTLTPALRDALIRLRPMIDQWQGRREMEEIHERIDMLVHGAKEKPTGAVSGWTHVVFHEIEQSPNKVAWRALLLHARSLTQSTASRKWQQEAVAQVDKIGRGEFLGAAHRWLALGPMPDTTQQQVPEEEADYQKGFIWTLGALGDTSTAPDIADFAFACFRKIPQIGAVSHRVGNACVNALAAMPGLDAVIQISRLAMRVKYDVARRLIEKALMEAAERNNVGRDDLEAMSVPTLGLNHEGVRIETMGNCQARLAIENREPVLAWSRESKSIKSVPADVKSDHAEAVAEIKKAEKELSAVLSTQRLRLERQMLSQASCPFDRWRAWYLDHPVTSVFASSLIWEVADQTAAWWEGKLVDWAGNTIAAEPSSPVRLWHPIRSDVQTVLSWRCWLEDRAVRQPFKQAHREVYLLTDAERQTDTYSNRFAAHIVRQHQFAALCRERGWQFKLMGNWDSANTPTLELPRYNMRAEFHVDFAEDAETSGHAIYITIGTDRVQFLPVEAKPARYEIRRRTPLRLVDIPPVVFSEVMRDIDLLVGVTSIGTDPAWNAEPGQPHAEYWHRFAEAELSTAAENRRSVLETLLPKLAIRDRCRIEGRYLTVRGESNQYRIHLGSGNVIMEPGSRYLCIVRGPGDTASNVPLPFEGDPLLAVILSKAFLLASDKAIRDETILRQIRQP